MPTIHNLQSTTRTLSELTIRERFQELNTASSRDAATLSAQGKRANLWGLLFTPLFAFLRVYLRQGEWRHGIAGLVAALFAAYKVFVSYAKLWEHHHGKPVPPPSQP